MQRIKEDFRVFLWLVWKYLNLPEPTPVQLDIAYYLQHGKARRRIIQAFRGVGKSWITSAYVVWRLLVNPDYKVMVVSASKERADAFTSFTKKLINEIPECQHLKPRTDQRDTMIAFEVNGARPDHSPSVKSVGITGQLTGSRADEIVADDVEVPNNSATQAQRDKLGELVKEFDAILKPGGLITYLGTPQNEMSLYNELQNRGYDTRIWPARYPKDQAQRDNYGIRLAPMIANAFDNNPDLAWTTTEPRRFDDKDLRERELSYGKAGFMLQFMLDTSLSDADKFPLKLSDLIVMNLNPTMAHVKLAWGIEPRLSIEHLQAVGLKGDRYYRPAWHSEEMREYSGTVMAIDPSGRGKDLTAYCIVKFLNGYLYLINAGGFAGGYSNETLTELAKRAKVFGVNHVVIEANFGDGMFTELIKPHFQKVNHPVKIEEVKHSQQKEARIIDTLEPVLMQHRLVVDESVIKKDLEASALDVKMGLFYQLTRITRERGSLAHDDKIDALAIAVAYWVQRMAQDADTGLKVHREELMDKMLDDFMDSAIGRKPRNKNWLSSFGL